MRKGPPKDPKGFREFQGTPGNQGFQQTLRVAKELQKDLEEC